MQKKIKDFEAVYSFFTRKDFVGDITDDLSPDLFTMVKKILFQDLVLMPSDGTCFVLSPVNSITYSCHLNTTEQDKKEVYRLTLEVARWISEHTPIKALVAYIAEIFGATLHYSEKIGMTRTGTIQDGFLKNGKYSNIAIMTAPVDTIIKELSTWQQQS